MISWRYHSSHQSPTFSRLLKKFFIHADIQPAMMNLHFYLFEFLALTSAATSTPLVFLNTSESSDTLLDRPSVGMPDPRFRIEINFDGPKFPPFSCLMNTVAWLEFLGNADFMGSMEKASLKTANYPEVGMTISPSVEGGRMDRRIVIWGLSQGVAHMMHQIRFQAVTFTLFCT